MVGRTVLPATDGFIAEPPIADGFAAEPPIAAGFAAEIADGFAGP